MNTDSKQAGFFQLTPFLIFVGLFLISTFFFSSKISPIFSCTMAIMYSFFTFRSYMPFNKKIELFISGSAHPTVITMGYIYIFSAVFTYVLKIIGGIDSAINIGLYLVPSSFILPGIFAVASAFAVAIGTSMGTIAAFLPIGIGFAQKLGINPSLMAGIVVGGAMLGDNLSIISDTTIAATQTTGARMSDKFKANFWLVLPAFILTLIVLGIINFNMHSSILAMDTPNVSSLDFIKILPYTLVFITALIGIDVLAVLFLGVFAAIAIGIFLNNFTFLQGTALLLEGFTKDQGGIAEVLVLSLFVAGLSRIVETNGGIDYLLNKFSKRIKNKAHAECSISLLTFLINAAVAINTVAILITGPVAKKIADKFGISAKRTACLLDIFSCICQGILPYAPQLLLAGTIANVSSTSILPYLYYQWFIFGVMIISIGKTFLNEK